MRQFGKYILLKSLNQLKTKLSLSRHRIRFGVLISTTYKHFSGNNRLVPPEPQFPPQKIRNGNLSLTLNNLLQSRRCCMPPCCRFSQKYKWVCYSCWLICSYWLNSDCSKLKTHRQGECTVTLLSNIGSPSHAIQTHSRKFIKFWVNINFTSVVT